MKSKSTRPDLIERFDALEVSARVFEEKHGLPQNCIAQIRGGRYASPRGEPTLARVEAALDAEEAHRTKGGAPAAPSEPATTKGRPRSKMASDVEEDLVRRIEEADTPESMSELNRHVHKLAAQGLVTDAFARFTNESLSRATQLWKAKQLAEEQGKAGDPVRVEVTYVNDWRDEHGPKCPTCKGTGYAPTGSPNHAA